MKISREKLKNLHNEITYLVEIYNTLLEDEEIEDIKIQLKYFRLTIYLINGILKEIENEEKTEM
jgi:hypothetical protein